MPPKHRKSRTTAKRTASRRRPVVSSKSVDRPLPVAEVIKATAWTRTDDDDDYGRRMPPAYRDYGPDVFETDGDQGVAYSDGNGYQIPFVRDWQLQRPAVVRNRLAEPAVPVMAEPQRRSIPVAEPAVVPVIQPAVVPVIRPPRLPSALKQPSAAELQRQKEAAADRKSAERKQQLIDQAAIERQASMDRRIVLIEQQTAAAAERQRSFDRRRLAAEAENQRKQDVIQARNAAIASPQTPSERNWNRKADEAEQLIQQQQLALARINRPLPERIQRRQTRQADAIRSIRAAAERKTAQQQYVNNLWNRLDLKAAPAASAETNRLAESVQQQNAAAALQQWQQEDPAEFRRLQEAMAAAEQREAAEKLRLEAAAAAANRMDVKHSVRQALPQQSDRERQSLERQRMAKQAEQNANAIPALADSEPTASDSSRTLQNQLARSASTASSGGVEYYLEGPVSASFHYNPETQAYVYVLGDVHQKFLNGACPSTYNKRTVLQWIQSVASPQAVVDLHVESEFVSKNPLPANEYTFKQIVDNDEGYLLTDLRGELQKAGCLTTKKELCKLGNIRVHYDDIRRGTSALANKIWSWSIIVKAVVDASYEAEEIAREHPAENQDLKSPPNTPDVFKIIIETNPIFDGQTLLQWIPKYNWKQIPTETLTAAFRVDHEVKQLGQKWPIFDDWTKYAMKTFAQPVNEQKLLLEILTILQTVRRNGSAAEITDWTNEIARRLNDLVGYAERNLRAIARLQDLYMLARILRQSTAAVPAKRVVCYVGNEHAKAMRQGLSATGFNELWTVVPTDYPQCIPMRQFGLAFQLPTGKFASRRFVDNRFLPKSK